MTLPPEQLARLAEAKITALARNHLGIEGVAGPFRDGASLRSADGRGVVLIEAPGPRVLGGAVVWALRAGCDRLDVLVDIAGLTDAAAVLGHLARLATLVRPAVSVWSVTPGGLTAAVPAERPSEAVPSDDVVALADELRGWFPVGGPTDVVVESGTVTLEVLGLEVARVVTENETGEPIGARIEAGVGRFDREVGSMMFAGVAPEDAVRRAVDIVAAERFPGAGTRPLSLLARERWLRHAVVADPGLVGAATLRPIGTTLTRSNLRDPHPALAVGVDVDGESVLVCATAGVDLDAPLLAADSLRSAQRLVVATTEPAAVPLYRLLCDAIGGGAEVVTVPGPWT